MTTLTAISPRDGAPALPNPVVRPARPIDRERLATASGFRVEIARTQAEIAALETPWRALEASAEGALLFQSWGWCRYLMAGLASGPAASGLDPVVVTVWSPAGLVALWPLRLTRTAGIRVLRDIGFPFSQYADVIVAPGMDAREAIATALAHLQRCGLADGLILDKVRDDAALCAITDLGAFQVGEALAAPFIDMTRFATYQTYISSLNTKSRKNLRNLRNRLERAGAVTHARPKEPEARRAVLAEAFGLRRGWLDERGTSSTAFRDPAFPGFVEGLAGPAASDIEVWALALEVGDMAAAAQCGFVHKGRYYAYLTGRNPVHDALSPGKLHLEMVIEDCHRRGITTVDLLAPALPYKLTFAKDIMPVRDLALGWSLKGRLTLDVWQRRLRPAAKALFVRLPDPLRRSIAGLANRATAAHERTD